MKNTSWYLYAERVSRIETKGKIYDVNVLGKHNYPGGCDVFDKLQRFGLFFAVISISH